MKIFSTILFIASLLLSATVQAQNDTTNMDSVSYSLGILLAQSLKKQGIEKVDTKILAQGIEDVFQEKQLKVGVEKANEIVQNHMQARQKEMHSSKIEQGQAFLDKNAQRDSVKVTDSGLQYEVVREGSGASPSADSKVTVHYKGTLLDGTVFDSSYDRGQPATFGVNQVISGWTEALKMMKEGAKWKLYLPHDLAYGERGAGQQIGPYETLIFEVELLEVE